MTAPENLAFPRAIDRVLPVALICAEVVRVLQIVPRWIAGTPPTFPGQYESRLLNALVGIGILGAVLVGQSANRHSVRGRIAYWSLLGVSCAVFIWQIVAER
jgi:hypothetical protein